MSRARFSLRAIFVITLLIAIYFAYLAHQDAMRRELIADIAELGGSVEYDDASLTWFQSSRVCKVTIPNVGRLDKTRLQRFEKLTELDLTDFWIVDEYDQIVERYPVVRVSDKDLLACYIGDCKNDQCPFCVSKREASR